MQIKSIRLTHGIHAQKKLLIFFALLISTPLYSHTKESFFSRITTFSDSIKSFFSKKSNTNKKAQPADVQSLKIVELHLDRANVYTLLVIAVLILFIGMIIGARLHKNDKGFVVEGSAIEPFFLPTDWRSCTKRMYKDINTAQNTIYIASYWFTHFYIMMALKKAKKRRVKVEIIFDKSTPNVADLKQSLLKSRISFVDSDYRSSMMHHKFIVIDNEITWVGSANLTASAFRKNHENMLRVRSYEVAMKYINQFEHLCKM